MGEYPTKREAINKGKQIISEASAEGTESEDILICRAAISIDNSPDHDCVYLKSDAEIIGAVVEGVTMDDSDEELIYLLTQVLAENFKAT